MVHFFSHLSLKLFKFQKIYLFDKYDAHVLFIAFNPIYLKHLFYIASKFSLAYTFLLLCNRNRKQTFITRPHHVHYYVFLFSLFLFFIPLLSTFAMCNYSRTKKCTTYISKQFHFRIMSIQSLMID